MTQYVTFYDLSVRHQLFLEQLKTHYVKGNRKLLTELGDNLRKLMIGVKYDNLGSLSKSELNKLLRKLKEQNAKLLDFYLGDIIRQIEAFMAVEAEVTAESFARAARQRRELPPEDEESVAFFTALSGPVAPAVRKVAEEEEGFDWGLLLAGLPLSLWAQFRRRPSGANGMTIEEMFAGFNSAANARLINTLRQSYANSESKSEFIARIFGPEGQNRPSGQLRTLETQLSGVVRTGVQGASSFVKNELFKRVFNKYMWISVMDERTSDVCISLNGKIFNIDDGPEPPAHIGCRSCTMPWYAEAPSWPSFAAWFNAQPKSVRTQYADVRGVAVDDLLRHIKDRPISPETYRKRAETMSTP